MHYLLSIYLNNEPLQFRVGLLLIFRRYYYYYYSIPILPTASQHKRMTYTNSCIYRVLPPNDEQ